MAVVTRLLYANTERPNRHEAAKCTLPNVLVVPVLMELPPSPAVLIFMRRACCCGGKHITQYKRVSHVCIGLKPVDQSRVQWLVDSLAGFYWCRLLNDDPIGVLP
jgi:hypothetical protein